MTGLRVHISHHSTLNQPEFLANGWRTLRRRYLHRHTFYRLDTGSYDLAAPEPEKQKVQVSCNSPPSDGNCNDWFIDPIPVVNPDGSTSPGQTRARLNYASGAPGADEGDFYLM